MAERVSVGNGSIQADLVVIGGGGSGLAAAVRAKELGVGEVVVLEKTSHPGGNAWVAVVMLGLGGLTRPEGDMTAWRDLTFGNMMRLSHWTNDAKLIRAYVDTYPELVEWLVAKGMRFDARGFDAGGQPNSTLCMRERKGGYKVTEPSRGPGFVGSTVVDVLLEECRQLGVKVRSKTRATKILLSDAGDEVRGVLAAGPDGEYQVHARAVVLAAGGFGANEAMMRRFFPEQYREDGPISTLCLGSSTGDGLLMAEELGLQMAEGMDSGIMGPSHHPWSHGLHEAVHRPEMLWINKNGERFVNESLSIMAGPAIRRQPGGFLWAVFDSPTKEYIKANPSARQKVFEGEGWLDHLDEEFEKEAGWKRKTVAIAGSLEELAQKLEVDLGTLRATVERYNELCDRGRDADYVKAPEFLKPLRTPPFYAVLGVRFCHGTSGGIKVNERMEVTGRHGRTIGGLYATGDNTGGWVRSEEVGLPGATLGFAFTSGYIAGGQVAARLRGDVSELA
jgi:fumarate reductase flavoprotein subunit